MTTPGIEPGIFGSVDRRLIHWATRPSTRQKRWETSLDAMSSTGCREHHNVIGRINLGIDTVNFGFFILVFMHDSPLKCPLPDLYVPHLHQKVFYS